MLTCFQKDLCENFEGGGEPSYMYSTEFIDFLTSGFPLFQ